MVDSRGFLRLVDLKIFLENRLPLLKGASRPHRICLDPSSFVPGISVENHSPGIR
jgi:hypothetical protein